MHLLTAIDHLRLGSDALLLDESERTMLARDLNVHFADRGYVFHAADDGVDWAVQCSWSPECVVVEPAGLVGSNLRDLMPAGRDAPAVRSLMNEIQMLLHEHPVNAARAARGQPVVNALWLWGFGRLDAPPPAALPTLYSDDAWLTGLWRLHGQEAHALREFRVDGPAGGTGVLLAWSRRPRGSAPDALSEAECHSFGPSRAAVLAGRVAEMDMLLGDRAFVVDQKARWQFWRRGRSLQSVFE